MVESYLGKVVTTVRFCQRAYFQIFNKNDLEKEIQKEIEKCSIYCANCHLNLHFDKKRFQKYEQEIRNWEYKETKKPLDKELVIKLYEEGIKQIDIAKRFNRNKSVICGIIKRKYANVA